jgi:hypothetical protein
MPERMDFLKKVFNEEEIERATTGIVNRKFDKITI